MRCETWQFMALVAVLLILSNALTGALFWHAGRKAGMLSEREKFGKALSDELEHLRAIPKPSTWRKRHDD